MDVKQKRKERKNEFMKVVKWYSPNHAHELGKNVAIQKKKPG